MNDREGVIKFAADHTLAPAPAIDVSTLAGWRRVLFELRIVGQDRDRYDGAGFGNVSQRVPPYPGERGRRAFVVTGTQTGKGEMLAPEQWVLVSAYDCEANRVTSRGALLPSSEAMTHGAIYDLSPAIRCVLHVHAPRLWKSAAALRLPQTAPEIGYGTPDMARAVTALWRDGTLSDRRIVSMSGHEDGVIAFGKTPDEAGQALITALASA